ncbi:hypothetical protein [Streptomyces sp. bgisy027]|uniref:hypothetical protein n=1 Tax=Streptomyces sp. bgisy027 TaxID=3413770 RepID=UPI003D73DADC
MAPLRAYGIEEARTGTEGALFVPCERRPADGLGVARHGLSAGRWDDVLTDIDPSRVRVCGSPAPTTPPPDVDGTLAETAHALDELDADGVLVHPTAPPGPCAAGPPLPDVPLPLVDFPYDATRPAPRRA